MLSNIWGQDFISLGEVIMFGLGCLQIRDWASLMRSVKATGGFPQGSSMTETRCNVWLLSMCSCEWDKAVSNRNTLHLFLSNTNICPNLDDTVMGQTLKLLQYLESSADGNDLLCNIANSVTAESAVNVDQARDIDKF